MTAPHILFIETTSGADTAGNGERLSNTMLGANGDWEIIRIADRDAALEVIQQRPVGVVVASFDGQDHLITNFFRAVKQLNPGIIRLALLSAEESENRDHDPQNAHQTIASDCGPEHIEVVIKRSVSAWQRLQQNSKLEELLSKIDQIPTPPAIYFKVREEIDCPNSDSHSIASVIARDLALSARVLKVVNSGFFALPCSVSDLHQAITMLGQELVLGLALSVHLYDRLPLPGLNLDSIWKHGFFVSALAKEITAQQGGDLAQINASGVAGLLHDIGGLVLLVNFPEIYQSLLREADGNEADILDLELDRIGVCHPELGGLILELWCLPEAIVEAVSGHHETVSQEDSDRALPSQAIIIAEWLANEFAQQGGVLEEDAELSPPAPVARDQVETWWKSCEQLADQILA